MTLRRLLLVCFAASLSCAAQGLALLGRAPINPQLEQELLTIICPHEVSGRTCTKCPAFTSLAALTGKVSLENAIRGHFTSAQADELVVALMGCEPHMLNWGGTALFERRKGRWHMRWYDADYRRRPPTDCRKFTRSDGRDVLLCYDRFTAQALLWLSVFAVDFARDRSLREKPVFGLEGITCWFDHVEPHRSVRIVEATERGNDLHFRIAWSPAQCSGTRPPRPDLSQITLRFDGSAFLLTPESETELTRIQRGSR